MVPTIGGAFIGMATGGIILQHPIIASLVMLAAVIGLQFAIVANRNSPIGIVLLLLMTGVLGWWIGPMLNYALALKNGAQLVGYAAGGTGLVLFAMATIATTTKRDFSFLGKFLFVGMIALIIAMFANMFFQIPALALALSTIAIVIFSLFLLYDLSRIVTGGETNYIVGHDRRVSQLAEHLREPAAAADGAHGRARLASTAERFEEGRRKAPFAFFRR
jgi:modulator of FtsH protease